MKETYGNVPSDSSDDEDWNGTAAMRKRKKTTGQVAPGLQNGNASTDKNEATTGAINHNLENNEHIRRQRTCQKSIVKDTNDPPNKLLEGFPKSSSTGRRVKSSPYRRLGEAVTQVTCYSYCFLLLLLGKPRKNVYIFLDEFQVFLESHIVIFDLLLLNSFSTPSLPMLNLDDAGVTCCHNRPLLRFSSMFILLIVGFV